jgi:hypothetical protein
MKTKKRYQDMTAAELAAATKDLDKPWQGPGLPGRAMTAKERREFEAWREKALAEEASQKDVERVTLLFPSALAGRIGAMAKSKHTTPARLLQRIVEDALHRAVA